MFLDTSTSGFAEGIYLILKCFFVVKIEIEVIYYKNINYTRAAATIFNKTRHGKHATQRLKVWCNILGDITLAYLSF